MAQLAPDTKVIDMEMEMEAETKGCTDEFTPGQDLPADWNMDKAMKVAMYMSNLSLEAETAVFYLHLILCGSNDSM